MGFSIANAGAATEGMLQVKDRYDQYRRNAIVDEGLASNVRQQQEREAFERMARQNIQGMQWNPGQLPQGQVHGQVKSPAAEQVTASEPAKQLPKAKVGTGEEDPYAEARRIYDSHVQSRAEQLDNYRKLEQYERIKANPSAAERWKIVGDKAQEDVVDYANARNSLEPQKVTRNIIPTLTDADKQSARASVASAKRLTELSGAIGFQESRNGKADTSKPNYAGAMGPMQITPDTWATNVARGVIPKEWSISNPEHNQAAGDRLIDYYDKKYGGDPAKVAAAYYGGEGAVNADGSINRDWRDKKNPKAPTVGQYVDQVVGRMGGAQPQQQAAAPQQAPQQQNLSGQATMVSGPNYDLFEQQLKQKFDFLNMALRNTFGSQERLVIQQQLMALQQQAQELPIKRLADSAQFNPQAMQQLVSLFAGRVGQQLGVLQDGKGNVQLVGANGQPIPGQWGQVMPAYTLAATIGDKLTPSYAAARAAKTAAYDEAQAKSSGESEGKRLLELQKLQMQGHNMIGAQMMHGEMDIQKMLLEQGMSANEIKQASYSPAGDGIVVRTPRGVFEYKPGGVDPKTKVKTEPTLTPVMVTGGVGGAFQGAYPRG